MKNIICIDLTKFNNERLSEFATFHKLDYNNLLENKKEGFAKVYIDLNTMSYVAFTTKKDKSTMNYTSSFTEMLKNIESLDFVKEPKEMNLDSILDKISKYGIDSLSLNEKSFLDNTK